MKRVQVKIKKKKKNDPWGCDGGGYKKIVFYTCAEQWNALNFNMLYIHFEVLDGAYHCTLFCTVIHLNATISSNNLVRVCVALIPCFICS